MFDACKTISNFRSKWIISKQVLYYSTGEYRNEYKMKLAYIWKLQEIRLKSGNSFREFREEFVTWRGQVIFRLLDKTNLKRFKRCL